MRHVRACRLQQFLRVVRKGLPAPARRPRRGRAVEQRRMRGRPLQRGQGPRNKDGHAFLQDKGNDRQRQGPGALVELQALRRHVLTGHEDSPEHRAGRGGLFDRRGLHAARRNEAGAIHESLPGNSREDPTLDRNPREHRARPDADPREDGEPSTPPKNGPRHWSSPLYAMYGA